MEREDSTSSADYVRPAARPWFVDGHVHLYPPVPISQIFAALGRNAALRGDAAGAPLRVALLLADPRGIDGFERLRRESDALQGHGWQLDYAAPRSLRFGSENGDTVLILRGQQLVTAEGLEVLSCGAMQEVGHGRDLVATLDRVRDAGGWSTIAWGVGKWLGARGKVVEAAIRDQSRLGDVALGDNAGRPRGWNRVAQFELAADRSMPILPGSDPLPIADDERRIGSYGFEIDLPDSAGADTADILRESLFASGRHVRPIGARVGILRFARNQARLRFRPRSGS